MSGVRGGDGSLWLREVAAYERVASDVAQQYERMRATAEAHAVIINPCLAKDIGYAMPAAERPLMHGMPVWQCHEVGGVVVASKWLYDSITENNSAVLY